MKTKLIKWAAFLFAIFILEVIIMADMNVLPRGFRIIYDIPYGDKVGHLILFGILTLLINLTFIRSIPNPNKLRIIITSGLALAMFMAVEEFSQIFFSNRTFDLMDLTAGYLGVGIFSIFSLIIKR